MAALAAKFGVPLIVAAISAKFTDRLGMDGVALNEIQVGCGSEEGGGGVFGGRLKWRLWGVDRGGGVVGVFAGGMWSYWWTFLLWVGCCMSMGLISDSAGFLTFMFNVSK